MALVVEDGTGMANADAYISVTDADAYHLDYVGTAWTGSTAVKESAIRRATRYLDGLVWKGTRTHGREQALDWPRYGVTDCDGNLVPSDEVAIEVVQADALLAFYEAENPGALDPNVTLTQLARREKVDVIEVEYRDVSITPASARPVVTGAMDLIKCLLIGGQRFLMRA